MIAMDLKATWEMLVKRAVLEQWMIWRSSALITSFPKCGRTWLRFMIGHAINRHHGTSINPSNVMNLYALTVAVGGPRVIARHAGNPLRKRRQEISIPSYAFGKKVILLIRDPRDVVVSWYFHRHYRDRDFNGELGVFWQQAEGGLETIIAYMNYWYERRNRFAKGFMLLRYEDMHHDPGTVVREALDFLGYGSVGQDSIEDAVQKGAFESMRAMENGYQESLDEKLKPIDPQNENSFKTRRGKIGGFVDYFDDQELLLLADGVERQMNPNISYVR